MSVSRHRILVLLLSMLLAATANAGERGWFGVDARYATQGFWLARKLESVEILAVAHGSPAQHAGLRAGDRILRIDDCPIPGCSILQAGQGLYRNVGDVVRVRARRPDGTEYEIQLVAGRRPD